MIPTTAAEALAWLDRYAIRIDFQELAPERRRKNRVILQYRNHLSGREAVGARTIAGAILKAARRAQIRELAQLELAG